MARGIVKFFSTQKGYGFIMPEGKVGTAAPDVYVHIWSVVIGPNNISMNVSWLALVVSALLSKRLCCQKPAETFRLGENRNWELIIPIGPNN